MFCLTGICEIGTDVHILLVCVFPVKELRSKAGHCPSTSQIRTKNECDDVSRRKCVSTLFCLSHSLRKKTSYSFPILQSEKRKKRLWSFPVNCSILQFSKEYPLLWESIKLSFSLSWLMISSKVIQNTFIVNRFRFLLFCEAWLGIILSFRRYYSGQWLYFFRLWLCVCLFLVLGLVSGKLELILKGRHVKSKLLVMFYFPAVRVLILVDVFQKCVLI